MLKNEKNIEDKLKELQANIPLKWRVQSTFPNKINPTHAIMISYIDARDVMERLDDVIGISHWQSDFKEIKGTLFGGIGILIKDNYVWKWDAGTPSNTEKEKGESSDAFKRAAVKWGINRQSYFLGSVKIPVKEYAGKFYPSNEKGKFLKGKDLYEYCNKLVEKLLTNDVEITDGSIAEYVGGISLTDLEFLYEMKRESLTPDEQIHAERIINNKEENNYQKLYKQLQTK